MDTTRQKSSVHRLLSPTAEGAQVLMVVAVFLPVLLGMVGIALDVGLLITHRTERQRTADAAALAGAQYLMYNWASPTVVADAKQWACTYAQKNDFGTGTCPNSEVIVNLPPGQGPHTCAADPTNCNSYVEVKITRTDPTTFMKVLGINNQTWAHAPSVAPRL